MDLCNELYYFDVTKPMSPLAESGKALGMVTRHIMPIPLYYYYTHPDFCALYTSNQYLALYTICCGWYCRLP